MSVTYKAVVAQTIAAEPGMQQPAALHRGGSSSRASGAGSWSLPSVLSSQLTHEQGLPHRQL